MGCVVMIGKLISSFFNFLLTIIMSIVQLICLPLNALFDNLFPDFTEKLSFIGDALEVAYSGLSWAVSLIPPMARSTILFILTIELGMLAVMKSAHVTSKVWSILQKLKFW